MTPTTHSSDAPVTPDVPDKLTPFESARATALEIIDLLKRHPEWGLILFAWIVVAFLPVFWFTGEDHWWSELDSPILFQITVPFVVAALLWQDRNRLASAWRQTSRSKRHGQPWLIWLGCVLILTAHFVHMLTMAAAGLLLVATGIIYLAYGQNVLKQARRALLFGLTFLPPPAKLLGPPSERLGGFIWGKMIAILQKMGKFVSVTIGGSNSTLNVYGHSVQVTHTQFSAILATIYCLLIFVVWRREKIGPALVTMAAGALFTALLTFFVPLFVLILPFTPFTSYALHTPPLIYAAFSVAITVLVKKRIRVIETGLTNSTRAIGKISEQAQKATERATAGVASSVGGRSQRAGKGFTRGTEAMIDGFVKFITKPFKRKRKNHW